MRIFTAFAISLEATHELQKVQSELQKIFQNSRISWTRPATWHITLEFLGERSAQEIKKIESIIEYQTKRVASFLCSLRNLQTFPNEHHPQVIACEVGEPHGEAAHLQKIMHEEFSLLGLTDSYKMWRPHITLGRIKELKTTLDFLHVGIKSVVWKVEAIELVQSTLSAQGADYVTLRKFSLQ